jgi:chloramphenicol O-acetyltransferase type A
MATVRLIDLATWPRRTHFEHYRSAVECTFAITVELDVTALVAALAPSPRSSYLAQVWAIATVVNRHEEFRMTLVDGAPAVWDVVHPAFTVLDPETETFACLSAPYDADFGRFHDVAAAVVEEHRGATGLFPQGRLPAASFDVSSLPWTSFTGFTLAVKDGFDHLAPIVTLGRYSRRDGRTTMPLAVQVHHAAADGFHTARLVNELQELVDRPDWLG